MVEKIYLFSNSALLGDLNQKTFFNLQYKLGFILQSIIHFYCRLSSVFKLLLFLMGPSIGTHSTRFCI